MAAPSVPSDRTQHLVFLTHVWACAPFMLVWSRDPAIHAKLGDPTIAALRPLIGLVLVYLIGRTYLAWKNPRWLRWQYVFPPLDVAVISGLIAISHRGPLSNLTLLYFLPIAQAAGSLNVRWAAFVGFLVVVGTAIATINPPIPPPDQAFLVDPALKGVRELIIEDPVNVAFRVYLLIIVSSLMTYQARIAADYRAEARLAEDRNRLALDVHDGVQGSLIAVASGLELLGKIAERDPQRVPALAQEIRGSARDAADELRFLVQRLRPPSLTGGFLPAMRQYAHALSGRHEFELDFEVEGTPSRLSPETEQTVFRIVQEALNNVAKHAQASHVIVRLGFEPKKVTFRIQDNGHGVKDAPAGTGLIGMQERAQSCGGKVSVTPALPTGTSVEGWIPI